MHNAAIYCHREEINDGHQRSSPEESWRALPRSRGSTLKITDPELTEYFDNFAFDEVLRYGSLNTRTRLMVQLASLIACQALSEYRVMLGAALTVGVTPIEAKEIVYQAVPYGGMARVFDFIHATNDVLTERGIELPLGGFAGTADAGPTAAVDGQAGPPVAGRRAAGVGPAVCLLRLRRPAGRGVGRPGRRPCAVVRLRRGRRSGQRAGAVRAAPQAVRPGGAGPGCGVPRAGVRHVQCPHRGRPGRLRPARPRVLHPRPGTGLHGHECCIRAPARCCRAWSTSPGTPAKCSRAPRWQPDCTPLQAAGACMEYVASDRPPDDRRNLHRPAASVVHFDHEFARAALRTTRHGGCCGRLRRR
jgi:alkylhydroperoxidase/carboxymuconolactone decarboxylase family protein YurZ